MPTNPLAVALESIELGPAVIVGPNLQSPICSRQHGDADNFGQWYGLDHEAARNLRAILRGELSSEQWQKTRYCDGRLDT